MPDSKSWRPSRPLFAWSNNKGSTAQKIVRYFPPHRVYVEPHVGGGSVFFAKPKSSREILSDPHPYVRVLFEGVQSGTRCRDVVQSESDLRRIVSSHPKDPCDIYSIVKCSRDHEGKRPRGKDDYPCTIRWPPKTQANRLRGVRLERGNYDEVMNRFDGSGTLHYIDIPSNKENSNFRSESRIDPGAIKKTAIRMRGAVVISSDDNPYTRNLFCRRPSPFACYLIQKPGRGARRGLRTSSRYLLIAVKP